MFGASEQFLALGRFFDPFAIGNINGQAES
jgi:hypothetical protein